MTDAAYLQRREVEGHQSPVNVWRISAKLVITTNLQPRESVLGLMRTLPGPLRAKGAEP